jgi:outer membrane protein OmpA-like peptidoglycan-associated protein
MQDDDNDNHRAIVGWIVGLGAVTAIGTALALALGFATGGFGSGDAPAAATPAAVAAPAATGAAPAAAPSAPGTLAALPVKAKLYFELGSAALPADAAETLKAAIAAAQANAGAKLAISGFHDKTGNADQNHDLAKQRAVNIRDALAAAGVAVERIDLRKPEVTEGGADDREARRVEVTVE